jgi:hypothetical protein
VAKGARVGRLPDMAKPPSSSSSRTTARQPDDDANPVWFKPVMFGLMLVGLVWILAYYIIGTGWPIPQIGPWNIAVGFGIMFTGFLMTTRWR